MTHMWMVVVRYKTRTATKMGDEASQKIIWIWKGKSDWRTTQINMEHFIDVRGVTLFKDKGNYFMGERDKGLLCHFLTLQKHIKQWITFFPISYLQEEKQSFATVKHFFLSMAYIAKYPCSS